MKLNNKGFAITAVLYGILILFVFFVSSYLLVLSAKKDRVDNITSEIEDEYNNGDSTLIGYIKKLYVSGNPTLITQYDNDGGNSVNDYYYSYQDIGQTWGLMNDGFKIDTSLDETTTGLATTVTDIEALTNGTEGNIRYFGPSDSVNNYIYFNCSDYSNQTSDTCQLWRIIGIVDGKVKIIKNEIIGELAWDLDKNQDSSSKTYSSNWEESSLQLMLNSSYYNGDTSGTIIYYSEGSESTDYTEGAEPTETELNMNNIGIKNVETRNMISTSVWYLGGYSTSSGLYPNDVYIYERKNSDDTVYGDNPFTIEANIGLMYSSDYGYGTDLAKCNNSMGSSDCVTNNWLSNNNYQWLITPSFTSTAALFVYPAGPVFLGSANASFDVRPVVYLDTEIVLKYGKGTSAEPFVVGLK